jgi:hypothetical protein
VAWVAPTTFVSGNALTAAQLNVLSADLLETAPGKATAAGQLFVSTGANAVTPRTPQWAQTDASETTTSIASFGDLATVGPSVSVTVSASCIVMWGARISNGTASGGGEVSWAISGATSLPAPNGHTLRKIASNAGEAEQYSKVNWQSNINPGVNTFTLKYTTPTGGTGTFQFRDILVIPL